MVTVELTQDGDMWCALVGPNLQEGTAGFGKTQGDALRALAAAFDKEDAQLPEVMRDLERKVSRGG